MRHGEVHNPDHIVYADLPGFGLSDLGRRQADEAGEYLAPRRLAAVVASPLRRARETAAAIARPHGLEVRIDDELTEWGMAQRWKGLVWEELDDHYPGELDAYLRHPWDLPWSAESLAALAHRMASAIGRWSAQIDGPVAVVSHQDPIQAARLGLTGRSLHTLNGDKPLHAEVFELVPADPWQERVRWAPPKQTAFPPTER